jgi:capsular exopolysaccharide synthesis family protein
MDPEQRGQLIFREAHLRDYWRVVWQGRWTILAIFCAVVGATVAYTMLQTPIYRATAIVEIQPKPRSLVAGQDASGLGAAGYGWIAEEKYHNTQMEIIRSRDVAQRVVRVLGLSAHPRFAKATDIANAFRGMVQVDSRRDTGLIEISMMGADPHEITEWVNAVAEAYVARNFEKASENVSRAVASIRGQIADLQDELSDAEETRIDALEETQIFNSQDQEEIVSAKLKKYHETLSDVRMELNELTNRLTHIRNSAAEGAEVVVLGELGADDTLRELLARRNEAAGELQKVKVDFKPDHPEYEKVQAQLDSATDEIRDRVQLILKNMEKRSVLLAEQADNLQEQIRKAEDFSLQVAKATSKYDIVKTDAETKKRVFDLITKTMNEVQLGAELMNNNVSVLDSAMPPITPIKPRKRTNFMIGAMLGLALGLGAVFFLDYLDNTIRTPEDVERYLGLSVLGVIPKMAEQGLSSRAVREAFQSLRTSIIFSSKNRRRQVLLITSTGPQEGKSSNVANLARTMAAAGDRVLIVDCDLRRPTQHTHHHVEREHGLTNYLAAMGGETDWSAYVKPSNPPTLHVLSCGPIPPNPPELLGNERFAELLQAMRARYDWILLDSPPASSLADASLLASLADMIVLVVQHNRTDRDMAVKTLQQLRAVNTTIAGAVLNNVDLERTYHKDYYYAGYYYYTEDEAKKSRKRSVETTAQAG